MLRTTCDICGKEVTKYPDRNELCEFTQDHFEIEISQTTVKKSGRDTNWKLLNIFHLCKKCGKPIVESIISKVGGKG